MAIINGIYVFVEDEELTHDAESTSHPVETGIDVTDHVKVNPIVLNLSGKIVSYVERRQCPVCGAAINPSSANYICPTCKSKLFNLAVHKASDILAELKLLQKNGSVITYTGRNTAANLQIQGFSTSHPYTNAGGCDFSMTLKEVRFAKSAFDATENTTNNTGTQQIEKGEGSEVYHDVKSGDCIWNLVITGPYKNLDPKYSAPAEKCKWVVSQNPSAFSQKEDFRTLQAGKKILVGYRK